MENKPIKYIELCAGIGGFRLGIEKSDFQSVCVHKNEVNDKCEETYFSNFNEKFDSKDIFDIDFKSMRDFDLLCAGFPCQPFSLAGKQNGFLDERGKIFFQISKCIYEKKPPLIFLENVANLAKHNKGETLNYIRNDLETLGYYVFNDILDSANFGLPQSRPRLYIVAFKKDKYPNINYFFPEGNKKKVSIREILENRDYSIPISSKWEEYIDFYTNKITEEQLSFKLPKTRKKLERISNNCNLEDCIFQIRSSGIRAFSLDGAYPTFAISNSGGGAMIPVLSKERRHLSVLEIKHLMGFPDWFTFNISRTDSIKQLANAVCPPVISAIFDSIIKATR